MWLGFAFVGALIFAYWLYCFIKATKDPEVIEASDLRMTITRYRKYKEAKNRIQEIYRTHGVNSPQANEYVDRIISELPNMNEWRKFMDYQLKKKQDETRKRIKEPWKYSN